MDVTINIDPSDEHECVFCFSKKNTSKGYTPLMWLAQNANIVKYLFLSKAKEILKQHPEEINKCNELGWTPLMLAVKIVSTTSNIEMVKLLLDHNADVNIQNHEGWTALMISVAYSRRYFSTAIQCIKLLFDYGADADIRTRDGIVAWYALSIAEYLSQDEETINLIKKYTTISTNTIGGSYGFSRVLREVARYYESVPDKKEV